MKREDLYKNIDTQIFAEHKFRMKIKQRLAEISKKREIENKKRVISEKLIRAKIRHILKTIAEKKATVTYRSTGLNTLDDLFMNSNFLSTIETSFNTLTTSKEQRDDYRDHVISGITDMFKVLDVKPEKEDKDLSETLRRLLEEEEPDIQIAVEDELQDDEIVGPEAREMEEEEGDDPEEDENAAAMDPSQDLTGRNRAQVVLQKIEKSVRDYYSELGNPADKNDYKIYMLANLDLYFKKWEKALMNDPTPESNPEVDQAISDAEDTVEGGDEGMEEPAEEGGEELEF